MTRYLSLAANEYRDIAMKAVSRLTRHRTARRTQLPINTPAEEHMATERVLLYA